MIVELCDDIAQGDTVVYLLTHTTKQCVIHRRLGGSRDDIHSEIKMGRIQMTDPKCGSRGGLTVRIHGSRFNGGPRGRWRGRSSGKCGGGFRGRIQCVDPEAVSDSGFMGADSSVDPAAESEGDAGASLVDLKGGSKVWIQGPS